jgi:hypothetical protein
MAVEPGGAAEQPATPTPTPTLTPEALSALVAQLTATKPAAAEAATTTSVTPADAPDDVRKWLKALEDRINAKEADEKKVKETDERTGLQKQITKLVGEGDVGKLREALSQFEQFFIGKLSEKDQKLTATEAKLHETVLSAHVGKITAGVLWASPAAARQAQAILDGMLEVVADGTGNLTVRGKGNGKPAADLVKDILASEDCAHFLDPSFRGRGGLGRGSASAKSGTLGGDEAPKTLDDAVIQRWAARHEAEPPRVAHSGFRVVRKSS